MSVLTSHILIVIGNSQRCPNIHFHASNSSCHCNHFTGVCSGHKVCSLAVKPPYCQDLLFLTDGHAMSAPWQRTCLGRCELNSLWYILSSIPDCTPTKNSIITQPHCACSGHIVVVHVYGGTGAEKRTTQLHC